MSVVLVEVEDTIFLQLYRIRCVEGTIDGYNLTTISTNTRLKRREPARKGICWREWEGLRGPAALLLRAYPPALPRWQPRGTARAIPWTMRMPEMCPTCGIPSDREGVHDSRKCTAPPVNRNSCLYRAARRRD